MQPQTEEQRGKSARALAARGPICKAMKGLVVGAAASTAEHRKLWTAPLIPTGSGRGAHITETERPQEARAAWRGGRYKEERSAMREQGRSTTQVLRRSRRLHWDP